MEAEQFMPEMPAQAAGKEATWQFRGRATRLESVSIALWSWAVVGALTSWFCFWLVNSLGQVAARLPH